MKITERKLRRIIRSVIRETQENIYAPFESESGEEELSIEDIDHPEYPEGIDSHDPQGPFGMTPEQRRKVYSDRDLQGYDPLDSARYRSGEPGYDSEEYLDDRQVEDAWDLSKASGELELDTRYIGRRRT